MNAPHFFDKTLYTTHAWIKEVMKELGWDNQRKAYQALRVTLHALRDRLTVEEVAQLGAQLPMIVRGFYYEGWSPSGKPLRQRHKEDFLANVLYTFMDEPNVDPEPVVRAVFQVLARRISEGEIEDIKHLLPKELRELWPESAEAP